MSRSPLQIALGNVEGTEGFSIDRNVKLEIDAGDAHSAGAKSYVVVRHENSSPEETLSSVDPLANVVNDHDSGKDLLTTDGTSPGIGLARHLGCAPVNDQHRDTQRQERILVEGSNFACACASQRSKTPPMRHGASIPANATRCETLLSAALVLPNGVVKISGRHAYVRRGGRHDLKCELRCDTAAGKP